MAQALAALLVKIGISTLIAQIAATVVVAVATTLVSRLLFGGSGVKSETTESAQKISTPTRVYLYGKRKLFGKSMLFDTAQNGTTVDVWAFLDGRANACTDIYLNDDKVTVVGNVVQAGTDGRYSDGVVTTGVNLGLPTETAFAPIVSLVPTIWTNDHRGDGIVSAYLTKQPGSAKKFLKRHPSGDGVSVALVLEGQLLYDPRDDDQDPYDEATWLYTENAALHLLHYYMVRRSYDWNLKFAPVAEYWINAANKCDEAMTLHAGGTEPRYRGCVTYDSSKLPGDVISELLACFDGWVCPDANGCIKVYAGELYEPTVTINADHLLGYSLQYFVEDEDFVNQLNVQYVSALNDYNTAECQAWTDDADIASRGRINSDAFSPQVPSHTQARRLAKRSVAKRNAYARGTAALNFSGRSIVGERFIRLEIDEVSPPFSEIVEVTDLTYDFDTHGLSINWVAISDNIDAWNPATEDGQPAPTGTRVPLVAVSLPVITAAVPEFASGGSSAQVRLTISGADRDDLTWYARWKLATESVWNEQEYSDIDPGPSVELLTGIVPLNASIDLSVLYIQGDGNTSEWSATSTVSTSTAGLAPGPVTDVSASAGSGTITVNWRNPGSGNYAYTRNYYGTTNVFGAATALTPDDVAGALAVRSETYSGITAGTYYVWSRSFNASGVGSTPVLAGTVTVT